MTNREFLSKKSSKEIGEWLDQTQEVSASTIWSDFPSFSKGEFTCPCGSCKYSSEEGVKNLDYKLLCILQAVRNKYGKPVVITCGARCDSYNDSLTGSVKGSYHTLLKAADFYISGVTSTEKGRDEVIAYMKAFPGYKYAYHNKGGKYPNMGSAVHVEVR